MKSKVKKTISLPLINSDKRNNQHYYSICIKAIKDNKDGMINKKECIDSMRKLKKEALIQERQKIYLSSLINNSSRPKLKKLKIINKVSNRKRTLSQILDENQKTEKKLMEKRQISAKRLNLNDYNFSQMLEYNLNRLKANTMNPDKLKTIKIKKLNSKRNIKNNNRNALKNKKDEMALRLPHRYYVFKKINEYLESNNIPIFELLKDNPFQRKPYQISRGYEFLEAVKFDNYEFVKSALQTSKDYLFVFDYYGQTCYHWAAKLGNLKMLKILIEFGKYHNQKDFKGRTPLYLAAYNNNKEVCDFLLKNQANIHLKDKLGNSVADIAGSRELRFYLMDFFAHPFSNPIYRKKIADFLKIRRKKHLENLKEKLRLRDILANNEENENNESNNEYE
jgi:hypothetical protein